MGRAVPEDWDPSHPHPDTKRETLAQHLARGSISASRAYAMIWDVTNPSTAKANACRVKQEPAMAQRVLAIREELARRAPVEPEAVTAAHIPSMMCEITAALEAALAEGVRAQASPALLASLRRATVVHLGRIQKLTSRAEPERAADPHSCAADLERLRLCNCEALASPTDVAP
jgi:hypothetical protein